MCTAGMYVREREREKERERVRERLKRKGDAPQARQHPPTRRPVLLTALSNAQLPHAVCVYNRIEPIIEITPGDPLMVPEPLKGPKA